MSNLKEMQEIKQGIMNSQRCSNDQAVRYISRLLGRSPRTIYEYLSMNRPDIPKQSLELLKLKLDID